MKAIAHAIKLESDEAFHFLEDHLRKVSSKSSKLASEFEAEDWLQCAGVWHDLGKYRAAFQDYIFNATGINPEAHIEIQGDTRTNHASTGAIYACKQFRKKGLPLAYMIAGHHAGLPDYDVGDAKGSPLKEILKRDEHQLKEALSAEVPPDILDVEPPNSICPGGPEGAHLWIRMMFSCLVDADFLDTESFMSPDISKYRNNEYPLSNLLADFNHFMTALTAKAIESDLNQIRTDLLNQCRNAASEPAGIFTMTIPTGGGKTLSSLAFSLEHAVKHGKRRIIYAIPYTSIIEQTASIFKSVFTDKDVVLEHHSNMEPDDNEKENHKTRLATENWDSPIIVTTTVQLFESLFAARTSRCRKLHNIANSVVVIDEIQLLPVQLLDPIRKVMSLLASHYGVTFVFSTATPTGLSKQANSFGTKVLSGLNSTEIIQEPGQYFNLLKRVNYHLPEVEQSYSSWVDIANKVTSHSSALVIVNKRQDAKDLFEAMPKETIHLSALMCPQHRSNVIDHIKSRLKEGLSTHVISTQLVEAGVDFDFPVVYRALAGLDSIVQAAGRCNREGRLERGNVFVFKPPSKVPPGMINIAIQCCISALAQLENTEAIDSPETFEKYFNLLFQQVDTDEYGIAKLLEKNAAEFRIQFRSAAQTFRMIENKNSQTVYVRYGDSEKLLEQLRYAPSKTLLRKLQRYSVTVYENEFNKMLNFGEIEEINNGFYIQSQSGVYDDSLGLVSNHNLHSSQRGII